MIHCSTLPQMHGTSTDAEMAAFEDGCFAAWVSKVDELVEKTACVSIDELPDIALRDLYDDGASVAEAARMALDIDG